MADKGLRVKGKTYKSLSDVPEQYRAQWEAGSRQKDPGNVNPDVGPNAGRAIVPHVTTFSGIVSTLAKTYRSHDEAIRHNVQNAHMMRRDPMIMGPLLARQRAVALLNWSVEPEDKTSEVEVRIAKELTKMIGMIPRFTEYRRNLLEAVWYGRYAIQHKWSHVRKGSAKGKGVIDWIPVHGDKIMFRYDDGTGKYDPNEIGIKVSPAHVKDDIWAGKPELEYNTEGSAVFLRKWERSRLALHKHLIMDGDYEDPTTAGMIHGVGLRHFLYWAWFQKQETLAQLAEIVERTGMGFTIYYYPAGNEQARAKVEEVAEDQAHKNQIIMPYDAANPGSYGIDQIQPVTAGIPALTNLLDEYWGSWIIRFILGQTLSMRDGGGGLGTGTADLHKESFLQIIEYDAHALDETLTQDLVRMYVMFNYPSYRHVNFKFKSHTEKAVPLEKLQSIQAAWSMGAKVKAADVMDLVGMTVAGEEDDALYNPQLAIALKQFRETMNQDREQQVAEELAQQQSKEKESVQRYAKLYDRRSGPVPVRRPARRGPKGMTLGGSKAGKADKPYKSPKELVYKDPEKNSKDGAGPGDHADSDWDVTWKQFLGQLTGLRADMPEEAYGSAGIAAAQKYMPRDPGDKENPDYKYNLQYQEEGEEAGEVSDPSSSQLEPSVEELQDIEGQDDEIENISDEEITQIVDEEKSQLKGALEDLDKGSAADAGQEQAEQDLPEFHPEFDKSKDKGGAFNEDHAAIRLANLKGMQESGEEIPTDLINKLSEKELKIWKLSNDFSAVQKAIDRVGEETGNKDVKLSEAFKSFEGDELASFKNVMHLSGRDPETLRPKTGDEAATARTREVVEFAKLLGTKSMGEFLMEKEVPPAQMQQLSGMMKAAQDKEKEILSPMERYEDLLSRSKREYNSLVQSSRKQAAAIAKAEDDEERAGLEKTYELQQKRVATLAKAVDRLGKQLIDGGQLTGDSAKGHLRDLKKLQGEVAPGKRVKVFPAGSFAAKELPELEVGGLPRQINQSLREYYALNKLRLKAQDEGNEQVFANATARMVELHDDVKDMHADFKNRAGDGYSPDDHGKPFQSFLSKAKNDFKAEFGELKARKRDTDTPSLKMADDDLQSQVDDIKSSDIGKLRKMADEAGIKHGGTQGMKKSELRDALIGSLLGEDATADLEATVQTPATPVGKPESEPEESEADGPVVPPPSKDLSPEALAAADEALGIEIDESGTEVQNPFMTEEAQKFDLSKYPGVRHISVDAIDPPKNLPDAKITVTEPFNYRDRMVVGVDINGVKVPFYVSTGSGRKKTVVTDKFYPFFGVSDVDGWLNKAGEETINKYYDQPILEHVAKSLNEKHKDLLSEHAKDPEGFIKSKIPQDSMKWEESKKDSSDWVFSADFQEGLNPTDLTDGKDPKFVSNIVDTARRLQLAVYGKSSIAEDDPRLQSTETEEGGVIDKATGSGLAQSIAEGEVSVGEEGEERGKAPVAGQPPAGDGGAEPPVTGDGGEGAGMPEGEGDGENKITEEELLKRLPNEPETLDLMDESYTESRDRYIDSLPNSEAVFADIDEVMDEYEGKVRDLSPASFRKHMTDVLFEGKEPEADSDLGKLYSLMISQPREKVTDILANIRGEQIAKRLSELDAEIGDKKYEEALRQAGVGEGSAWDAVVDQANVKMQEARQLSEEQEALGEPDLPIDVNLQGIEPGDEEELGGEQMQVEEEGPPEFVGPKPPERELPEPPRQVKFDWDGVKISARRQDYIADIEKAASGMTEEQLENQARSLGQIKPEELGQLDKDELAQRFIAGVKRKVQRDQLIEDYGIEHSYDEDESGEGGFLDSYIEDMKRLYPEPTESDTTDVPNSRQDAYNKFIRETARDRYIEDKVLKAQHSELVAEIEKTIEGADYGDWVAKRSALVTLFGDAMIGTTGRRIRELPEFDKKTMAEMDSNVLATAERYLGFNPNEDRFQRGTMEETRKAQVEGAFAHMQDSIEYARKQVKQYSDFMNSLRPDMAAKLAEGLGLNKTAMLEFGDMPLHKQTFVASKLLNHAAIISGHSPDRTENAADSMAGSIDYLLNNQDKVQQAFKKEYGTAADFLDGLNWKHITLITLTLLTLAVLSSVGRSR